MPSTRPAGRPTPRRGGRPDGQRELRVVRQPGRELLVVVNGANRYTTGWSSGELVADVVETGAEILQNVSAEAVALDEQTEQKVLSAHLLGAHRPRFLEAELDHLLDPSGRHELADDDGLVAAEDCLHRGAHGLDLDPETSQNDGGASLAFAEHAEGQGAPCRCRNDERAPPLPVRARVPSWRRR